MKKNRKGFTLAELLIVTAIIAVLVAVSLPIFSGKTEKSREATDIANMRSAKRVLTSMRISGELTQGTDSVLYYDGNTFIKTKPSEGYGRGTRKNTDTEYTVNRLCRGCTYNPQDDHKDDFIIGYEDINGNLHIHWQKSSLDFMPASDKLPSRWISWGCTDSRGVGGSENRDGVLKALGLSDRHEYAIYINNDGTYSVYIYNGNLPTYSTNKKTIINALGGETAPITVSEYIYNTNSETTEYVGEKDTEVIIKPSGSKWWVKIVRPE